MYLFFMDASGKMEIKGQEEGEGFKSLAFHTI